MLLNEFFLFKLRSERFLHARFVLFLQPVMSKRLRIHDTCGVHNLHGMPGLISGLGSILAAGLATSDLYGDGYAMH